MRQRIVIQEKQAVTDSYGEESESWAVWKSVWAAVEPLRGREYLEAQSQEASVEVRIRIRYLPGVVADRMRVIHEHHVYDIESVLHINEGHREIHLMCKEQV